jgi:predicted nucleic acid-binding protein
MPTDSGTKRDRILLLDTSTAIALILADDERHAAVLSAVKGRSLGLAGHAWFETYSVLTRLPSGQRRSPADALRLLSHNFPESRFLGAGESGRVSTELASLAIAGGSVYDALVAAAARQHGLTLLSSDARAKPTYEQIGVDLEWLP